MCDQCLCEQLDFFVAWPQHFEPEEECIVRPVGSPTLLSLDTNTICSPANALFEQSDIFTLRLHLLVLDSDVHSCCPTEVADMVSFRDMPL